MQIFHKRPGGALIRMDEAGEGGACHRYAVTTKDMKTTFAAIDFQMGSVKKEGYNGVQDEDLLKIVIDRLQCLEAGPFSCDEYHFALGYIRKGLDCLDHRDPGPEGAGS